MADSIAKLAVVITGDAGPLAREMNRATNIVRRMDTSVVKLSSSLSALKGNWGAAFSVGGPAALALTAMTGGLYGMARAGDQLLQKLGEDKLATWAGQWERVNEQLGIAGLRFTMIAREASSALADRLAAINKAMFPDSVAYIESLKARKEAEKAMAAQKERAAKAAKEQAEANKKAAEAQQKERDALLDLKNAQRDRADQIRESVQTPAEQLKATFQELRSLLQSGFLDEQTAIRAAKEAMDRNKKRPEDIQSRPGIAAVQRFSMAGFSALQEGKREMDRLEQVQKQQLKAEQEQLKVQQDIAGILRGQKPIELVAGAP